MKTVVVGYGSIGRRHADLLKEARHDVAVVSRRSVDSLKSFNNIEEAISTFNPDYIVIASSTSEHLTDLKKLVELGFTGKVLVEKPLFDKPDAMFEHNFESLHVAYNLRFHPLIKKLKSTLEGKKVFSVNVYVGMYLPDWRPERDYTLSYSASKEKGGGVLRDLSHELDYILWIFGEWIELSAIGGKFSNLKIDSDDVFALLLKTTNCPALSLQMNYLDREPKREIRVNADGVTYMVDLINGTFSDGKSVETTETERKFTYSKQHEAILNGEVEKLCSYQEGLNVVQLIASAEEAVSKRMVIKNE